MITQIITFLIWPVFIYVSYKLCAWTLKKYDAKQNKHNTQNS